MILEGLIKKDIKEALEVLHEDLDLGKITMKSGNRYKPTESDLIEICSANNLSINFDYTGKSPKFSIKYTPVEKEEKEEEPVDETTDDTNEETPETNKTEDDLSAQEPPVMAENEAVDNEETEDDDDFPF